MRYPGAKYAGVCADFHSTLFLVYDELFEFKMRRHGFHELEARITRIEKQGLHELKMQITRIKRHELHEFQNMLH